jgi:hypothetical protein
MTFGKTYHTELNVETITPEGSPTLSIQNYELDNTLINDKMPWRFEDGAKGRKSSCRGKFSSSFIFENTLTYPVV